MRFRACLAVLLAIVGLVTVLPGTTAHFGDAACVEDIRLDISQEEERVVLRWEPVAGAVALHLHRAVNDGEPDVLAVLPGDATTFTDQPVPHGTVDYILGIDGHPHEECPRASLHMHGPPPPARCVEDLAAEALPDGRVRLTWTVVPRAERYVLLRATGDGPLAHHDEVSGFEAEFVDARDLVPGASYRYALVANHPPPDGLACPEVVVTAVPFLPPGAGAALPLVAAAAAYAWLRRRA